MKRVFVDTAGWYAYARGDDPAHAAVSDALELWEGRLVTSNFVFDELITLVERRLGHKAASDLGRALRGGAVAELVRATGDDEEEAWKVFVRHGDKGWSYTDCVSFAMMRRLGLETAVTTDRHFAQAGFTVEPG